MYVSTAPASAKSRSVVLYVCAISFYSTSAIFSSISSSRIAFSSSSEIVPRSSFTCSSDGTFVFFTLM